MKPDTDFEDISTEIHLRNMRIKAWERKKHYAPDDPKSWVERIIMLVACLIFAISIVCGAIMNYEKVSKYLNDVPVWIYSVVILFLLCVVSVSLAVVKSAKRG